MYRIQRHGSRSMFVRDLQSHGKRVMIHLDAPRLICMICRKTFMAVIQDDPRYVDGSCCAGAASWMACGAAPFP